MLAPLAGDRREGSPGQVPGHMTTPGPGPAQSSRIHPVPAGPRRRPAGRGRS